MAITAQNMPMCPYTPPYMLPMHPLLVSDWLRLFNVPTTANQITEIDQAH